LICLSEAVRILPCPRRDPVSEGGMEISPVDPMGSACR
jgi:hypothetical protein